MTVFQIASLLIVLAGAFGAINHFVFRLPSSIGILLVSLCASFVLLLVDRIFGLNLSDLVRDQLLEIDFSDTLLEGVLGLLLFAGALHVKLADLRSVWVAVLLMATLGVVLSTAIVGVGFSWITGAPLGVALVFGALISPTDPVAVLGVLGGSGLDKTLETQIAGESLFNDGVGYVVYLILVGLAWPAASHDAEAAGLLTALELFVQEALGGAVLGVVLGWLVFRVMRHIDDYPLEVLLTLGLAFGGYELALALHVSGPITAVCAGLLIGDVGARYGMSEETRRYVDAFWVLIDEILNALLFMLIGFEVFAVTFQADVLLAGAASVLLALAARLIAVSIPILALRPFRNQVRGVIPIMTWGGLKGGISVALALALPDDEWKPVILTATYVIVVFSIVVQGLSIGKLARRLAGPG